MNIAMDREQIKQRLMEIEKNIQYNAEMFKNGEYSYEELHNSQYPLFKEKKMLEPELNNLEG